MSSAKTNRQQQRQKLHNPFFFGDMMGRGRLMRTKKHEVVILTKAEEKARFQQAYANKMSEHGFLMSLREHIGKAIDKIDPLELAAVLGMTVIIEPMIEKTIKAGTITLDAFKTYIEWFTPLGAIEAVFNLATNAMPGTGTANPYPEFIPGQTTIHGQPSFVKNPQWTAWNAAHAPSIQNDVQSVIDSGKLGLWVAAFVVSFCIIRWGDKMINAGTTGLSGILKLAGLVAA
jgi:hypothetical protein